MFIFQQLLSGQISKDKEIIFHQSNVNDQHLIEKEMRVNLFVLFIACKNVDFSARLMAVRLDN